MTNLDLTILGLGYEGITIDDYLQSLKEWNIDVVVDVRLNPISRKSGFSKTKLSEAIRDAGMDYIHRRELGNPKENRAGFTEPASPTGRAAHQRYRDILDTESGREALEEVADLARSNRVALLCFEANERCCHRKLIREAVIADVSQEALTTY